MINRTQRSQLATTLRVFLAGRTTLDEFWSDPPHGWMRDRGVAAIVDELDRWSADKARGAKAPELLDRRMRDCLERALVFLQADLEYRWGGVNHVPWLPWPCDLELGQATVWPFYSSEEFLAALAQPRLLSGRRLA